MNRTHRQARNVTATHRTYCEQAQLPCALCGHPIDYQLPPTSRWSFTSDHIVPLARGGSLLDLGNRQPSHRWCNGSKGAGQPPHTPPPPRTLTLWPTW